MKQTIRAIVGALGSNPLALALVIVNVLYLTGGFVIMREERTRTATVIADLLDRCIAKSDH
jgi:hypothetical protein